MQTTLQHAKTIKANWELYQWRFTDSKTIINFI
jgi:hypothetical protein